MDRLPAAVPGDASDRETPVELYEYVYVVFKVICLCHTTVELQGFDERLIVEVEDIPK